VVLQGLHNVCDSRSLLTNGDVNAVESLGLVSSCIVEGCLLVNDGIDGNSGLAGLSITNDQFSLTSSNWNLLIENEKKKWIPKSRLISDQSA
jgi:hypothetical protein